MIEPVYDQSGITIYHGRAEDVLPTLPTGSIDAVICDPPYGTTACAWDTPIDFAFMWRELKRLTKRNAAIVLFGSQPFTSALVMSNPGMFRYCLIWDKMTTTDFQLANIRPMRAHEEIVVFSEGSAAYNPQMTARDKPSDERNWRRTPNGDVMRIRSGEDTRRVVRTQYYPTSIIRMSAFAAECNNPQRVHPTQKPLALLEYLILTYTNPGDTILDFACGSGTCGAASKKLGRQCIQVEQDAAYVDVAISRLQQEVFDFAALAQAGQG